MDNHLKPVNDAPLMLHIKLDRLWLVREEEGAVTHTTIARDPDNPDIEYAVTFSLCREYSR